MSRFWSVAALVVMGIIVADVLIHPGGTATASNGLIGMESSAVSGLLGTAPSATTSSGGGVISQPN